MKVDLSRIDMEPLHFVQRLELSPEALDPAQVVGPMAVLLEGVVRRQVGVLRAEGRVEAAGPVRCARCLEPAGWRADETFAVELVERPVAGEDALADDDDREVVFVDGDLLDLAELAAEQVLLALPMRTVCREDCAGLCPRCGANLNLQGLCQCSDEVDPRWSALRDLKAPRGRA